MGLNPGSERMVMFSKTYEGYFTISYNMFKEKPLLGMDLKCLDIIVLKKKTLLPQRIKYASS